VNALADLARLAGVSKATASRALSGRGYVSERTRDLVVDAAAQIGYIVSPNAASLVTGQTKNVGVVIPFLSGWFFSEVLEGTEAALLDREYDMTIYNLTTAAEGRRRIFEFFLARKRFDAVMIIGVEPSEREVASLRRLGRPLVCVGGPVPGVHSIAMDDTAAARLATEHLIALGHTRIVHIGGSGAEGHPGSVHGKRFEGYRQAMNASGLPYQFAPTRMSMPGGFDAASGVISDPSVRPSAIFAACDEIALGVIVAARQLGIRVPADLSVIGIDGHEYAEMFGLTTVEQSPRDQGRLAVELLMRQLDAGQAAPDVGQAAPDSVSGLTHHVVPEPELTRIPVSLVERSSTGPSAGAPPR
jgi:DNA-binding LacI/PurR family transcriptional regulator